MDFICVFQLNSMFYQVGVFGIVIFSFPGYFGILGIFLGVPIFCKMQVVYLFISKKWGFLIKFNLTMSTC